MIYALGSNGAGQLATGNSEDAHSPTLTSFPRTSDGIQSIVAGGNHTVVLCKSGEAYATGENVDGRCGIPFQSCDDKTNITTFQQSNGIEQNTTWKLCSATWESTTFVSEQNEVYSCGTGNKGELGLGENITSSTTLQLIPNFPPKGLQVIALAASMNHTLAVLSNGEVYGWGNGRKGQLGQPAMIHWTPCKIANIPFEAINAVCGRDFSYIVGPPETGQHLILGADKWSLISQAPKTLPPWMQIGASWGSIFVLLKSGQLLSWGRNDHGQLGPDNLAPLEKIAVGSEHALALTNSGKVLAWGWGEHGNCGEPTESNGDVKGRWNELAVDKRCVAIGAGCATSWLVCADG
ncbi:RCC1/BLIP-II [Rhizodiscina lignyota]|uniref:RCC1/BLIP-II n=1 Tax=Rhizodiscina lignyota TaxID=1504668 RepID=A0A9P4I8Z5_9PEZI|nr:RCC1/BLIP-II [Rhizodiscina lignyota]